LPPGKYKIVKQGEPFNTLTNFTTFELKQGELTEMTIVINDLQQFIGSGELGLLEKMDDAKQAWHNYLNLKGSLSLFSDNKISEDNPSTKITFTGKIDNKLTYDANPYYLNFRQTLKEEWVKNDDYDYLNIGLDELKFTNTAIYYFTNVFGIYSEVDVETKIFDNNYYDINNNVLKIENNGDSLVLNNVENFKLSEPFSPLELQEEIGLNFTILRSASSNLYLRTGLGFIQTVNNNVYSLTDSDFFYHFNGDSASVKYEFTELENKNITGLIFTAGANFRFTNNLSYFSTLDFIYNLNENRDYNLEWENDLVFKIFKYLSIDYNFNITYDYEKNSVSNYIVYDHQLALEFSYYINR
ncbi:MAG: DUF481 domain-containing protein, partial [Candidatus Delongbacteria bacterium]|nr:DUF481 domain-containing protein [Candidatus Delongbacteria bacterium]